MARAKLTIDGVNVLAFRNNYRTLLRVLFFSMSVNVIFITVLIYSVYYTTPPGYYLTSINGRYYSLTALDQPNLSYDVVIEWATEAAVSVYTYEFVYYESELQKAARFFTPQGWNRFTQGLAQSNILDVVKAKKLAVSAVVVGAPVITRKGQFFGKYLWRVNLPLLLTFESASEFRQQRYYVMIQVERISTLANPRGIGITQFTVTRVGGGLIT